MSRVSTKPPFSIFLAATVVIFVLTLSAADSVGFVPYYIDGSTPSQLSLKALPQLGDEASSTPVSETPGVEPTHIRIASIGLDLPVQNPATRDVAQLDALLTAGPARYVDSAQLDEAGNILIFGHSSHLPVVHNQMYKAFNQIPDLKAGDIITLEGGGKQYLYSVIDVQKIDASEGVVDLAKEGHKLTIVTCDTLTGKSARFVMTAELIGSSKL